MIHVPDPTNPKEKRKMIDIKNHLNESIHNAAIKAMNDVKAEEARVNALFGLTAHKVAGPFERFMSAWRAGVAAFRAVLSAN